jgi:hypothetical protein
MTNYRTSVSILARFKIGNLPKELYYLIDFWRAETQAYDLAKTGKERHQKHFMAVILDIEKLVYRYELPCFDGHYIGDLTFVIINIDPRSGYLIKAHRLNEPWDYTYPDIDEPGISLTMKECKEVLFRNRIGRIRRRALKKQRRTFREGADLAGWRPKKRLCIKEL